MEGEETKMNVEGGGNRRSRLGERREKPNMKGAETGAADVEL